MSVASKTTKKKIARPVSAAAARIVQEAMKPDVDLSRLGDMARSDPAMALRVVSLVNSPAFQLAVKVKDVGQATSLLGLRGLRNIALSILLTDMIPPSESGRVLLANALRRAMACRGIALHLGVRDRDSYFTTGLFLEAGLFVQARDALEEAVKIAQAPAAHRIVGERAISWEPHPQLGARASAEYGLDQDTIAAIAHHHDVEPPEGQLGRAAWLSERLAAVFEGGDHNALVAEAARAGERVGLSRVQIDSILEEMPEAVRQSAQSLDCEITDQRELDDLINDAHRGLVALNQQYEQLVRSLEAMIAEKDTLTEQLRHANEELQRLAATDALTTLPNKRGLEDFLLRTLSRAQRERTPTSLLMIDVDHFKRFNDTWGHAMGDEVLRVVGSVLLDCVRTGDMAARYGGEEFTIVLPVADEGGALAVAERVRGAIAAAGVPSPEGRLAVTASIGVATLHGGGTSGQAWLFERADAALYDSKRSGRNRVTISEAA